MASSSVLLENVVCEAWIESAPLVCLESMFNESCAKQVSDIDNNIKKVDAIIVAVKHDKYKKLTIDELLKMYDNNCKKKILFDLHSLYDKDELESRGVEVWRM